MLQKENSCTKFSYPNQVSSYFGRDNNNNNNNNNNNLLAIELLALGPPGLRSTPQAGGIGIHMASIRLHCHNNNHFIYVSSVFS